MASSARLEASSASRSLPNVRTGELVWTALKYVLVALVLFCLLLPIYWIFSSSIKPERDFFVNPPAFVFQPTLINYERTLSDLQFLTYLRNSVIVSFAATGLTLVVASLAAHGLARFYFPGAKVIAIAILAARLVPGATMVMPYYVLFRWYGLVNTIPGLILAYVGFSLPFACWLLYGFFLEIPSDVEDSARIDGCSDFGVFWRIVLPLTRPGLAAAAILVFLGTWNEFLFALVLAGRDTRTLPVYLATFISERTVFWGSLFSVASFMVLPCLVLVLLVQRSLVRGLTAGAVKG
ncbi:MAG: carbohydrate ABC transporter permease [Chloroflexi bacterium]|nr:carbohydrate ABC transporter permease [Chloroflexota bacterium]